MTKGKQVDPARDRLARVRRPQQHVFNRRGRIKFDVPQIGTGGQPTRAEKATIRTGVDAHEPQRVIQQPSVLARIEEQCKVAAQRAFFQMPGRANFLEKHRQRTAAKMPPKPQRADATGRPQRRLNDAILDLPLSRMPPGDNTASAPLHSRGAEKPLTLQRARRTAFPGGVAIDEEDR